VTDVTLDDVRVDRERRPVLDVRSLVVRGGRTTAVLGPNGSGKTTLLRVIAGLERSQTGRVSFGGRPVVREHDLAYVFQEQVFLRQSVRRNLELGLRLRGVHEQQVRERIEEAVNLVGIPHLLDRRADRLSGGEGRRTSLARALCLHAPLVLLDEPLEGLDGSAYAHLIDELPRILEVFRATTLLVTHSRDEALRLADDLVVLVGGRVHAAGDKHGIAANPRVTEVAQALGYTILTVTGRRLALPPNALKVGGGPVQFPMRVEAIVDAVDFKEIVGLIGEVRVRVRCEHGEKTPTRDDRLIVHPERLCELESAL
jgi:thiamine transport system ATP-binding protein